MDLKNLTEAQIERLEAIQREKGSVPMSEVIKPVERHVSTPHNSIGSSGYGHIIKPLLPGLPKRADSLSEGNSNLYILKMIEVNKRIKPEEPHMVGVDFQPLRLCFPLNTGTNTYNPDSLIWYSDWSWRLHEHKGRMDAKSITKTKRFFQWYPEQARRMLWTTDNNKTPQKILNIFKGDSAQIEIWYSKHMKKDSSWAIDDYSPIDGELLKWWTADEYKALQRQRDKLERETYNDLPFGKKE